jgi:hypothetical protein
LWGVLIFTSILYQCICSIWWCFWLTRIRSRLWKLQVWFAYLWISTIYWMNALLNCGSAWWSCLCLCYWIQYLMNLCICCDIIIYTLRLLTFLGFFCTSILWCWLSLTLINQFWNSRVVFTKPMLVRHLVLI